MSAFVELTSNGVLSMTHKQLRGYVFHYVDDERVLERLTATFCEGCFEARFYPDLGINDCLASMCPTDDDCIKWYQVDYYLQYMIEADLRLRNTLGDIY